MFKNQGKWIDKEWMSSIWSTSKRLMDETPATDAVLREIRAQVVEDVAMRFHESAFVAFEYSDETGPFIRADLQQYADRIRAGE